MIAYTTQLFTQFLGVVLPAWLSCEPIQIIAGVFIFGFIVHTLVRLIKS